MKKVLIYTDGSCLGNPGPGGWAAILHLHGTDYRKELAGGFRLTTNNRMEIYAAICGLGALKEPCLVELYTDSQYLRNAVEKGWLAQWQKAGWRKADKKPVSNVDMWRGLLPLLLNHQVHFSWLKGHAGHPENERCDALAQEAACGSNLPADSGYEAGSK